MQYSAAMDQDLIPFDWHRLLLGLQPPMYLLEVALRCLLVFGLLMLVMRLLGKRGQANLSPMQQMMLIALGSAAGDALLYPDVALAYAALVLFLITLLDMGLDALSARSRRVRDYVESHPRVLMHAGVVDAKAMRTERILERELHAALRVHGARSMSQVELAVLEVSGEISVFLYADRPVGDDDLLRGLVEDFQQRIDAGARTAR